MSIQKALMDMSVGLAEQGVTSPVEVRLGRDGWSRFIHEMAMHRRFMSVQPVDGSAITIHACHGTIEVRPADPRDAKCPHGIPWDYCSACQERVNG
jgi:hypothetical protein